MRVASDVGIWAVDWMEEGTGPVGGGVEGKSVLGGRLGWSSDLPPVANP